MRILAVVIVSLVLIVSVPAMSVAEEQIAAAGGSEIVHEHATIPDDGGVPILTLQEIAIGTAVVGGALVVGALATGSLSTGIAAAGAVVLVYTFMP